MYLKYKNEIYIYNIYIIDTKYNLNIIDLKHSYINK